MMNNVEEYQLSCTSPSVVTFSSQIDENELKSKSLWDPDWTIQREISVTFDKSLNKPSKFCSRRILISTGIIIFIIIILSIILPIIIIKINSHWTPTTSIGITTITTTQIESNSSNQNFELNVCSNLTILSNINLIGFNVLSNNSMSWSMCCSWCINVLSCRALTYDKFSSICYLKGIANLSEIFAEGYESAKYP